MVSAIHLEILNGVACASHASTVAPTMVERDSLSNPEYDPQSLCDNLLLIFIVLVFSRQVVLDNSVKSRKGGWLDGSSPDFHTPEL